MRIPYLLPLFVISSLSAVPAMAQETEIENNVPVSAEATTAIVPGKSADMEVADPNAPAKPDRVYTDGALSNPEAKAEDLGLASPGQKMKVDTSGDSVK